MKPRLILAVTIATLLAGCGEDKRAAELEAVRKQNAELADRIAAQEQAAAREKQAALEEKQRAAEEKLRATQTEAERTAEANRMEADRLLAERAAVEAERKRIVEDSERATAEERAAMQAELRKREEELRISEMKAAAELKVAAEAKARAMAEEKRMAAERAEREAEERRQQNAIRTNVKRTTDFFYDALDPHGDWDDVEGYGHVFQPREAQRDRNWRPYTDGEWVWTDRGWAWRSNEPHGWATAHYGRWVRHAREGWMWVPGSEWAPAWVSWRKNDDYIGWAPLPPEAHSGRGFNASVDEYYDIGARNYTFVPRSRFTGGKTYLGHVVPVERNVTIIQTTINVTNITYRQTNVGAVIMNNGPELAFVNARAATPVQQIRIERTEVADARSVTGPAAVVGGMLRLIAPVFAHEKPTGAPKVIRKIAPREIDRGWSGEDANAQKLLRERAAAEARKAEEAEREEFRKLVKDAKPLPLPKGQPVAAPVAPKTPVIEKKPAAVVPVPVVEKPVTPKTEVGGLRPQKPKTEPEPAKKPATEVPPKPLVKPLPPKAEEGGLRPQKPMEEEPAPAKKPSPEAPSKPVVKPPQTEPEIKKPAADDDAPKPPKKSATAEETVVPERPKRPMTPPAEAPQPKAEKEGGLRQPKTPSDENKKPAATTDEKPDEKKPAKAVKDLPKTKPAAVPTQKPVIARPDAERGTPPATVEKKDAAEAETKKEADPRASILKRKLTPEEKAALKEEGEKALKALKEKLGQ